MREESQLDAMRHAIRGDFERLAVRRGDQDLMRIAGEPDAGDEPVEAAPDAAGQRSWLARLLSPWPDR